MLVGWLQVGQELSLLRTKQRDDDADARRAVLTRRVIAGDREFGGYLHYGPVGDLPLHLIYLHGTILRVH